MALSPEEAGRSLEAAAVPSKQVILLQRWYLSDALKLNACVACESGLSRRSTTCQLRLLRLLRCSVLFAPLGKRHVVMVPACTCHALGNECLKLFRRYLPQTLIPTVSSCLKVFA